jgi:DNA-binding beta-propeller fold protein YncE
MRKRTTLNAGWMTALRRTSAFAVLVLSLFASCKHELPVLNKSGYPKAVADIMLSKCATGGCHNKSSYEAAAGLNLETWDALFNGSRSGAVVIPYGSEYSALCFFTNTDTSLGIALLPTMPVGEAPLTTAEYTTLKNWIDAGAMNDEGEVKFESNADREKIYVTNRNCDVVTVMDKETLLPMRYVPVGNGTARFPYRVKVSPDKKYWYVSFFTPSNIIQKFSAETDKLIGELDLGMGIWTSFAITSNSKYGYFVDNSSPGKIVYADLEQMQVLATWTFNNNFRYPLGIIVNEQLQKLYVGAAYGNFIYNIYIADPLSPVIQEMVIDGSSVVKYESALDPVELLLEPGKNECYVACAGSGEIRRIDMLHDSVWATVSLGAAPAFMDYSVKAKKLFVTCPDDMASFPGNRGAVVIINASDGLVYKKVNSGYQPYGIAVDDERGIVAIVNANISSAGPASHHASKCGEKNGNLSFVELSTMSLIKDAKRELVVFPFGISIR